MSDSEVGWVPPKVSAVVVTRNRRDLLSRCLLALRSQSFKLACIYVIDNASTDGTRELFASLKEFRQDELCVVSLAHNTGGAGGFAHGLRLAVARGAEWVWLMDDDAEPLPDSLTNLLKYATNSESIYGSMAVAGDRLVWPARAAIGGVPTRVDRASQLDRMCEVDTLPFLGFLIHRRVVDRVGVPDDGFFIAADDIEYSLRARRAGVPIFIVPTSIIRHPLPKRRTFAFRRHALQYLSLSPLKRYYDTRNRLLIARRYHGIRLLSEAVPGSVMRLVLALLWETGRAAQLRAFVGGFIDGLRGLKGQRHQIWGITE